MPCNFDKVRLHRSELWSSALGLGSSFGLEAADIEHAYARGLNYFYFGSARRPAFGRGVRALVKQGQRDKLILIVQTYTRAASLMKRSLMSGLKSLGAEHADYLLLGWWNEPPPERILDAARALREQGLCKHLMISCHNRLAFERHAQVPGIDAIMVRYNASHPGAEHDVFPKLGADRPAVIAYTATRWGDLINPALTPEGEPTPRASDCYRFALSNPAVQVCMAGPADRAQLDEALAALERGPLTPDEDLWMRRVGGAVKQHARAHSGSVAIVDRLMGAHSS